MNIHEYDLLTRSIIWEENKVSGETKVEQKQRAGLDWKGKGWLALVSKPLCRRSVIALRYGRKRMLKNKLKDYLDWTFGERGLLTTSVASEVD